MNLILNELFAIQNRIAAHTPTQFKRYLPIDWNKRLIAIVGARGTGKTTLVLQHYLEEYNSTAECLYFSADNPIVAKSNVYKIGKEYFSFYGNTIIIDEVHKSIDWSAEIKALYDAFPDKKIIILGSSKLNITIQKGDLSRRAYIYQLKGLSFREFIELKYNIKNPFYSFDNILTNHIQISSVITKKVPAIKKYFLEYKQFGFYPFFNQYSEHEYHVILHQVIDKIIYEDIPSLKIVKSSSSIAFKKLIAYLSMSKIPTVNVASMCNELDIKKETLYEYLDVLHRADIINIVRRKNATVRSLKNSRLLLLNPNLYYTISHELWSHQTDLGNIREAFFVSQLSLPIYASKHSDYTIIVKQKEIEVEIGGKNKSRQQLPKNSNSYLLKDDIEFGYENIIPLFLFGFLY